MSLKTIQREIRPNPFNGLQKGDKRSYLKNMINEFKLSAYNQAGNQFASSGRTGQLKGKPIDISNSVFFDQ
jgi:hypothetical protein